MDFGSPALSPRVDNDLQNAAIHDVDKSGDETALKREINIKTASEIMSNSTEIDAQKVWMGNKDQKKIATSDLSDAFVAPTPADNNQQKRQSVISPPDYSGFPGRRKQIA
jgi:hypothetical protein